jgi:hypothetical protein
MLPPLPEASRENNEKQIQMLMQRLLSMLDHPLMFLDLVFWQKEMKEGEKTYGRICIERILEYEHEQFLVQFPKIQPSLKVT